jgi:hypothetical protein
MERQLAHGYKNPGWDKYDTDLQRIVNAFDQFHASKGNGYVPPRWQLMKAQLWVESGGPEQKYWNTMPMQIGMTGDTGMLDVMHHAHVPLIAPLDLRRNFDLATIRSNPVVNIQAGMTLLHLKMAFFRNRPKQPLATPASTAQSHRVRDKPVEMESYVCAWRVFNPVTLYQQYNVGDEAYAAKLNFCMELINA